MSHIVESDASSTRRARRRRAAITISMVLLMLFFAFWYAYSYYRETGSAAAGPAPSCTPAAVTTAPKPSDITVNVYNATDRNGLAAATAQAARKLGLSVATVANDPLQKELTGVGEVRYGPSGTAAAKVVLTMVKGAKGIPDARTDASVDIVLGEKFKALSPPPKPAPAPSPAKPTTPPASTTPATPGPATSATTPAALPPC